MKNKAYTLTELIVVMGMSSVVMTSGLGMVYRVMREQKVADRENAMHGVAKRLTVQLRNDAHEATRATLTESDEQGEQKLVLPGAGEKVVTYVVRKNVIQWASTQEGEPTRRESFHFPENYHVRFSNVSGQRVTLTAFALLQPYSAKEGGTSEGPVKEREVRRADMHVEAAIGRNHRFLTGTKESGEP